MSRIKCPVCGGAMIRHGHNRSGTQRWICKDCRATSTPKIDNTSKLLNQFLRWLLSRRRQIDMPGCGRTFRKKMARFWELWPLAVPTGEIHRVVFVDGIYLTRNVVVLIAATKYSVLNWYVAKSENSKAWKALLSKIPPPDVVITDGGCGFEKARKRCWKNTRVQRCLFHIFCQIKRYTTTRPNLEAGVELYGLAKALLHIETLKQADKWTESYLRWAKRWDRFLSEKTYYDDKHWDWTHARLVKARNSLNTLISQNTMFTYLDPELTKDGPLPKTNNAIEGGVNAQLRAMLRDHRGLSLMRRVKAVFWWCFTHSETPAITAQILRDMPTDDDIEEVYRSLVYEPQKREGPQEWGDGLVWAELRHALPWRVEWD